MEYNPREIKPTLKQKKNAKYNAKMIVLRPPMTENEIQTGLNRKKQTILGICLENQANQKFTYTPCFDT